MALMPMPILFFVINFSFSIKVVRSEYIFRDWNYTMVTIYITFSGFLLYTDIMFLYYLDIGCKITFIDYT